ncbi:unnamed protein product [Calypogeia fissa]
MEGGEPNFDSDLESTGSTPAWPHNWQSANYPVGRGEEDDTTDEEEEDNLLNLEKKSLPTSLRETPIKEGDNIIVKIDHGDYNLWCGVHKAFLVMNGYVWYIHPIGDLMEARKEDVRKITPWVDDW